MLKVLLVLCASLVCSSVHNIEPPVPKQDVRAAYLSHKYKVSQDELKKLIYLVRKETNNTFPSVNDVLAIIEIESSFRHNAVSHANAKGYMQIKYRKTHSVHDNIKAGVWLLKDYHKRLKSEDSALHAYNVGIGNYRSGMRNTKYVTKFKNRKKEIDDL